MFETGDQAWREDQPFLRNTGKGKGKGKGKASLISWH